MSGGEFLLGLIIGLLLGYNLGSAKKSKVSNNQSDDSQNGSDDELPVFKPESSNKIYRNF